MFVKVIKSHKLFFALFIFFSVVYFSYFPGAYSPDSNYSFLSALGCAPYLAVIAPTFSLFWKILANNDYAPFVILYMTIALSMLIFIRNLKSYVLVNCLCICLIIPSIMETIVFAWKDNALLLSLLLLVVLSTKYIKFNNKYCCGFLVISFIAFTLRLNAVFAIIPFIYYLFSLRYRAIMSLVLLLTTLISFVLLNMVINKYIFHTQAVNSVSNIFLADIVKINYYNKSNITTSIPDDFIIRENTNQNNVDKMFKLYDNFKCNDILYFYPSWAGVPAFLTIKNIHPAAIKELQQNWIRVVYHNMPVYIIVRLQQLNNALWIKKPSDVNTAILDKSSLLMKLHQCNGGVQRITNKLHTPINLVFLSNIRFFYKNINNADSLTFDIISRPGTYLILNFVLLFCLYFRTFKYAKLSRTICISGICYAIGYLPIIPCPDYRYFLWTIVSFYLAFGLFLYSFDESNITNQ